LFHAYIRFLIENKNEKSGLAQWMRVIHNLANNSVIDGADEILRAIKSIEKLLPNSNDIIKYLLNNPQIDFFSSWQVLEEKIKSHLITKGDYWKEKIESTEKYDCFEGQIGFVLEFAGIIEYYENNNNCNWKEQEDKLFFNSFKIYADKAIAVFENKKSYDSNYVWERAVLTKGDYLIDASSNRKNLLTTDRNMRDWSWKRLLRIGEENKQKRQFVKQVFDDELFDKIGLQASLEIICESKTNTWRDCLIACPKLIRYCEQGFIRFINENDVILLGQSQMNHKHSEMYSMLLWKQHVEPRKEEFNSFKKIDYRIVKSSEEYPCIVLSDFCHDRVYYEINIYYSNNDELQNPYEIAFRKSKGENEPDKYGDDIKNILTNLSFEWRENYNGYFFTCEDSNSLMKKFEVFNQEILKLQKN